jgi:hypothetical protein
MRSSILCSYHKPNIPGETAGSGGARLRRRHARQCFRRLSFRGDLARICHRNSTSHWHDASHEGNACARMAAGKPDARRFPDISRFWATVLRFGQSSELKQSLDILDNFGNAQGRIQ